MNREDKRQTVFKTTVPCFVAEKEHAHQSTGATANDGEAQQNRLRDSPCLFYSSSLIRKHKPKRNHINCKKINNKGHGPTTFLGGTDVKKWIIVLLSVFVLAGCDAKETFETVDDLAITPAVADAQRVHISFPEETLMQTMEDASGGKLYLCDGYTITVQAFASGDLERTVQETTGFSTDRISLIETHVNNVVRYDCAWSAAGEAGDQVCRAAILDDGNYHYVVTMMTPAENAENLVQTWQMVLGSVSLLSTD